MAKAKRPRIVDPEEIYTVTLNVPGANLSLIIDGLPTDFTVEQAVLFRLFRDALPEDFDTKHFRQWCEDFEEALADIKPLKVKKQERIAPIPPLAPEPPADIGPLPERVVCVGKRKATKKKR